jgi:hypothetical protein
MICPEEICTLACFFLQSTGSIKSFKYAHHFWALFCCVSIDVQKYLIMRWSATETFCKLLNDVMQLAPVHNYSNFMGSMPMYEQENGALTVWNASSTLCSLVHQGCARELCVVKHARFLLLIVCKLYMPHNWIRSLSITYIFSLVLVIFTARVIPSFLEVSYHVIKSRSVMCTEARFSDYSTASNRSA